MSKELRPTGIETLADAYARLAQVRLGHAAYLSERTHRLARAGVHAEHVTGSLKAARQFLGDAPAQGESALVELGGLDQLVASTKARMEDVDLELRSWTKERDGYFASEIDDVEAQVVDRVEAYLEHYHPSVRVEVSRIGGDRSVIHIARPEEDDAVLLCAILAGRPPTRPDFLADDAVEEVDGPVYLAVRQPGVDPVAVHAGGAESEDALALRDDLTLLPIRAHLPVRLPTLQWPRLRLRARGPVLELQVRPEGEEYTHLVSTDHAELFTGYLVSLQVRGALEMEVELG